MAAINAYVSDEIKDRVIDVSESQDRSVSWCVTQALELWLALQNRYDCGPIDRYTVFQALELWMLLRPVPIIGELHAKMTPTDWDEIEQRILELKEQGE